MFTLLPRVSPIKVRILNRFLRVADHDLLAVLSKKKLKKINLRVRFSPLKIAFFRFLKMVKNFRSKSYMVTKSKISPKRKLGSLRNLRLFLIRYELISVLIFVKIRARTRILENEMTRTI